MQSSARAARSGLLPVLLFASCCGRRLGGIFASRFLRYSSGRRSGWCVYQHCSFCFLISCTCYPPTPKKKQTYPYHPVPLLLIKTQKNFKPPPRPSLHNSLSGGLITVPWSNPISSAMASVLACAFSRFTLGEGPTWPCAAALVCALSWPRPARRFAGREGVEENARAAVVGWRRARCWDRWWRWKRHC